MEIGGRITAALPENIQETITGFFGSQSEPESTVLPNDDPDSPVPAPNATTPGSSTSDTPSTGTPSNDTFSTTDPEAEAGPDNSTIQDSEDLPALEDDTTTTIPQDDTRNVERIINATPEN
jgi:hypothetical protein